LLATPPADERVAKQRRISSLTVVLNTLDGRHDATTCQMTTVVPFSMFNCHMNRTRTVTHSRFTNKLAGATRNGQFTV